MHSGGPTLPSKWKMVSYPHVLMVWNITTKISADQRLMVGLLLSFLRIVQRWIRPLRPLRLCAMRTDVTRE